VASWHVDAAFWLQTLTALRHNQII